MTALQASLLHRPLPIPHFPSPNPSRPSLPNLTFPNSSKPRVWRIRSCNHRRRLCARAMVSENASSSFLDDNSGSSDVENKEIFDFDEKFDGEGSVEATEVSVLESVEGEEKGRVESGRVSVMVFLVGVWASVRRGFEKLAFSEWLSWWPFWRQEKRLERLIAEADANPKDAAKQSALLAELNKHSVRELKTIRQVCVRLLCLA
ncbi:hypothetical protein Syun_013364 [Stephania yunnanensis]|uniref:Uncharacterized protein n=1 Tax=Stephania yunnanensis TaxID=152371 RepID=A0AAP0PII8_9MAGN